MDWPCACRYTGLSIVQYERNFRPPLLVWIAFRFRRIRGGLSCTFPAFGSPSVHHQRHNAPIHPASAYRCQLECRRMDYLALLDNRSVWPFRDCPPPALGISSTKLSLGLSDFFKLIHYREFAQMECQPWDGYGARTIRNGAVCTHCARSCCPHPSSEI